ncbi:DMT family transporter [Dendrosporobacter sp. 1207_IL3150]|uniref:DMT family transporter n=1 Tax=Dendrosporobacter sp. 1207_IL3150 TaxID=3084054 RepID=UPI002FD9D8D9
MFQKHAGTLMVLASATGFATLAIFIKLAYDAGANTVTILAIRFSLAALILWPILRIKNISANIGLKTIIQLCLMGALGYGTMSTFFALSIEHLPVSLAAMLLYTYPALVTILSFAVGDEKITWHKCIALAICFLGLFLILGVSFTSVDPLGIVYSLSASLVYSCYIVIGNRVLKNVNPLAATTYVCSSAALVFLIVGLVKGSLILSLTPIGWLSMAGIAILGTIVGILFFFAGLNKIGAANASIVSTTEPLITVLLSIAFLNDSISLIQGIGGLLIIAGVLILQLWNNQAVTANEKSTEAIT